MSVSPDIAGKWLDRWTLLTLVAAGVLLVWGAAAYTVFDDEAHSCRLYVMPAGEMVAALWRGEDPDPPLYYLLANTWVRLFGVGPAALRSLSILLFLAGLVFVRLAGQTWFDRSTGLAAMALCALHPAHLFFGFAARWYSLMFLLVAVLLWLSGRLATGQRARRKTWIAWVMTAAAVCYTNYFGPILGVLMGLIAFRPGRLRGRGVLEQPSQSRAREEAVRARPRKPLPHGRGSEQIAALQTPSITRQIGLPALLAVAVLYAPWFKPFWAQAMRFPQWQGGVQSIGATAARTAMALLTGNLASIRAWWVWLPMGVFSLGCIVLLVRQWPKVRPIGVLVIGCLVAGVASRSMIDKYIMTFSGPACVLAAALLVRGLARVERRGALHVGRIALLALTLGWIACGVNRATHQHWSSLRWLDPFERVIAELADDPDSPPPNAWVMTHPSARYYYACHFARLEAGSGPATRIDADRWRRFAAPPDADLGNYEKVDVACATPAAILERMESGPLPSLVTVETAGAATGSDDWRELREVLDRSFVLTETRRYLEDMDAAWKDRLDPVYKHPRWRIVVRRWTLRE